jgi:hypothetical protein
MSNEISRRFLLLGALASPLLARAATHAPHIHLLRTSAGRAVEVSQWRALTKRRGTIAFSHGAESAPWKYGPLVDAWSQAGYDVLAPLHVDSTSHPMRAKFAGMLSWRARLEDMRAVATMIREPHYFAAGHSYGGLLALTLGGAEPTAPAGYDQPMRDVRVSAVVAFSPPGPLKGFVDAAGYGHLAVPALIQTGDRDQPPAALGGGGSDSWRTHLAAYEAAAPGGERYALVLPGVDHYFGGLICEPSRTGPPQGPQLQQAIAISKLFLASRSGNAQAKRRLESLLGSHSEATLTRR